LTQKVGRYDLGKIETVSRRLGRFDLGKIESAEVVTDPARFPTSFKEAPELSALARQGKLPPVGERIGRDPLVLEPVHGIGMYGGILHRGFHSSDLHHSEPDEEFFASGPDSWFAWDHTYSRIVPNIARAFELSDDARTLTVLLRRGMHWSDGAPFTADDVRFWYEDLYLNEQVVAEPHANLVLFGEPIIIEMVDRHTVRFVSPGPNPLLPDLLASRCAISGQAVEIGGAEGMGGYAPRLYLSQFHPKYAPGGRAAVDRMAADAGFPDWAALLKARNDWTQNADLPVLTPWMAVEGKEKHTGNLVLERNPYSIWVDTEGNQLPYIDRISMSSTTSFEEINERTAAGEYDLQDNHLWATHLAHLKENEAKAGYQVHLNPYFNNGTALRLNLAYEADTVIGDLIRTADFRRALSLAIDRDEINDVFFEGMAEPNTVAPSDGNRYFPGPEYRTLWATTDVARANEMLDGLGLAERDAEGYRLRPDGERLRLEFLGLVSYADFAAIAEMIGRQWTRIGVDATVKRDVDTAGDGGAKDQESRLGEIQLAVFAAGSEDVFLYPDETFPSSMEGLSGVLGPPYVRWFRTGGKEGNEPPAKMVEVMDLWRKAYVTLDEAERTAMGARIHAIIIEEAFAIGLLRGGIGPYGMYVAKTTLGNVPARVVNAMTGTLNMYPMTFYFLPRTPARRPSPEAPASRSS
jgi:peptide/nickel transport system substrate-binding protein